MTGFLKRLFGAGRKGPLDYEQAKELAAHPDSKVRAELAARDDVKAEILYFLAEDADVEVRRQVAANPHAPAQANLRLAADQSDAVRGDLAAKIARVAPGLSAHEQDRLRRMTFESLEMLARDQIPKVRQILSEALQDVAHAPPDVIRRLARDAELVVAGPVLQFSPVLTDEDLLEIIGAGPIPGALACISRRSVVNVKVADAIAATDDVDAIAVLLGNPSAQIREETLDRLADRAADIEAWHRPMIERPQLSARTAQKLARFVAASLLQTLSERRDLDADAIAAVAAVVSRRIGEIEDDAGGAKGEAKRDADEAAALQRARALHAAGQLTETAMDTALSSGDYAFVSAGLAVLSGLPPKAVRKVVYTKSAKGMVAVTWKAGLSAGFGAQLQSKLLRLSPSKILAPTRGDHPLSAAEMEWQLEFFGAGD
ncbi:DUF2336 domain-containing protein [Paramagnetospirillum magneticum]|uniref:Uncharacterized protein conserved in bacteria n=1 Tax=Paramagnetospirillum magneticum (strain ATCC 700264 / AMB-1) TaxID=342108 RepID=Q2W0C8_PARM1|nr:DUF2336 domain-containing protein [Paramagnetospirillum magneticum]BAE52697.1 Uncharacterized protein conserved in bacteria [Paramagnetospirillum magneticum AMB-1]